MKPVSSSNQNESSKSSPRNKMDCMVTVNFPDIGIKESWKLDTIQKELLEKRPKVNCYSFI